MNVQTMDALLGFCALRCPEEEKIREGAIVRVTRLLVRGISYWVPGMVRAIYLVPGTSLSQYII